MKRKTVGILILVAIACAVLFWIASAKASAPDVDAVRDYSKTLRVFPGAEGFGVDTRAGRGGAIVRVTNLDAEGPGSLRAALEQAGPRTVIFDVAGIIRLKKSLDLVEPFITVAGQTAPSPGITITGAPLEIQTHDVLVQHLRFRVGDQPDGPVGDARDGIGVIDGPPGAPLTERVVVDHCSVSWAIDEGMSTWGKTVSDVTFRNCIIAENLSHSIHPKGEHSKGVLIGDHTRRFCIANCFLAHNRQRNPFVKGDVTALIVNNIIYNPVLAVHMDDPEGSGISFARVANNLLLPGPNTPWYTPFVFVLEDAKIGSMVSMDGNALSGHLPFFQLNPWRWLRTAFRHQAFPEIGVAPLTVLPANELVEKLLPHIGARPADRDAVDIRILREFAERKGRIIDSPDDVGGLPEMTKIERVCQVPENPDDDRDGNGYTNIEEWLHEMAAHVEAI